MTAKHGQDMRRQEDRIAEDEAKYQNHLRDAQTKAEQMIDDEKVMQVSKISSDKLYMSLINAFQVKPGLK